MLPLVKCMVDGRAIGSFYRLSKMVWVCKARKCGHFADESRRKVTKAACLIGT